MGARTSQNMNSFGHMESVLSESVCIHHRPRSLMIDPPRPFTSTLHRMYAGRNGGEKKAAAVDNVIAKLEATLERRSKIGRLRTLTIAHVGGADFSSNDYLGLARSPALAEKIQQEADCVESINKGRMEPIVGSTGSRLLSGNTWYHAEVEEWIAHFFQRESALIFNSGYDLNLGLLACLTRPGDAVVYDELVHNSTIMGFRLGGHGRNKAEREPVPFKHNDVNDLERRLAETRAIIGPQGLIYIAIEAVYSMDGDLAPLTEICEVAQEYGACVIVDEAHSTGILGIGGRGLVCDLALQHHPALLCSIHTFGKALGCHGAVLCGPKVLREYCVNYCFPFIYSTALTMHSVITMRVACEYQSQQDHLRARLISLIACFHKAIATYQRTGSSSPTLLPSLTAIQAVLIPGNERVGAVASALQSQGLGVRALRPPTVPAGKERLRIILHAHNTEQEVDDLARQICHLSAIAEEEDTLTKTATAEVFESKQTRLKERSHALHMHSPSPLSRL